MSAVGKAGWKITTVLISIPIGIAVRKGLDAAWRTGRPGHSRSGSDLSAQWKDALAWGAASGAGVALTQILTTRSAASVWRGLTGEEPPPQDGSKPPSRRRRRRNKRKLTKQVNSPTA